MSGGGPLYSPPFWEGGYKNTYCLATHHMKRSTFSNLWPPLRSPGYVPERQLNTDLLIPNSLTKTSVLYSLSWSQIYLKYSNSCCRCNTIQCESNIKASTMKTCVMYWYNESDMAMTMSWHGITSSLNMLNFWLSNKFDMTFQKNRIINKILQLTYIEQLNIVF